MSKTTAFTVVCLLLTTPAAWSDPSHDGTLGQVGVYQGGVFIAGPSYIDPQGGGWFYGDIGSMMGSWPSPASGDEGSPLLGDWVHGLNDPQLAGTDPGTGGAGSTSDFLSGGTNPGPASAGVDDRGANGSGISGDPGNSGANGSGISGDPGNSGANGSGISGDPGNSGANGSGMSRDPRKLGANGSGMSGDPGNFGVNGLLLGGGSVSGTGDSGGNDTFGSGGKSETSPSVAAADPPSTPVPEPSSLMLLGAGLLGYLVCRRSASRRLLGGAIN